jgi:hypothetical protein
MATRSDAPIQSSSRVEDGIVAQCWHTIPVCFTQLLTCLLSCQSLAPAWLLEDGSSSYHHSLLTTAFLNATSEERLAGIGIHSMEWQSRIADCWYSAQMNTLLG